jgi:aryl-alcohol dehydrogenase-like predicted oxidoreductase
MAITTRPLGRTQADVTILGYGAMELRGLPRGPGIADEDAGRLLDAVLDGKVRLVKATGRGLVLTVGSGFALG